MSKTPLLNSQAAPEPSPTTSVSSHFATVHSSIPYGYEGRLIEVEAALTQGLPNFTIVGLGGKAISEARERVRSALKASLLPFPDRKLTLNLAPAELKKDGVFLDLPIAIAVLAVNRQIPVAGLEDTIFVGELSLDGQLRPVRGIINIVESIRGKNFKTVILPEKNLDQAALALSAELPSVKPLEAPTQPQAIPRQTPRLLGFKTLKDVFLFLHDQLPAPAPPKPTKTPNQNVVKNKYTEVFSQIHGQNLAKRALIIALTGRHNLLLSGPPGAGKTLLAHAALDLLPPPTTSEQIAITKISSLLDSIAKIATTRPFRSPHHTASLASLVGGGPDALPGEISLAHHGILFLDELPEYPRSLLESLRQPLEDRQISISRSGAKTTYPADFILIATMNPCPCGFSGDPSHECICTPGEIQHYRRKLSGPLLDRIDLRIKVEKVNNSDLLNPAQELPANLPSETQVNLALSRQIARSSHFAHAKMPLQASQTPSNASLSSAQVSSLLQISKPAKSLLDTASAKLDLSARSYFKVIKVAQTISDLETPENAPPVIQPEHIAESLSYRVDI